MVMTPRNVVFARVDFEKILVDENGWPQRVVQIPKGTKAVIKDCPSESQRGTESYLSVSIDMPTGQTIGFDMSREEANLFFEERAE